jgi:hypothetical protein
MALEVFDPREVYRTALDQVARLRFPVDAD